MRNPWACRSCRATFHATYADCTTTGMDSSYWPTGSTSANAAAHCATNSYTLIHARHHDPGCGSYRALYPFRFLIKKDPDHPHTASAGVKNMWEEAP
nr:MAG TPA: hypothetical protein [Caudoviricetes sp.]